MSCWMCMCMCIDMDGCSQVIGTYVCGYLEMLVLECAFFVGKRAFPTPVFQSPSLCVFFVGKATKNTPFHFDHNYVSTIVNHIRFSSYVFCSMSGSG